MFEEAGCAAVADSARVFEEAGCAAVADGARVFEEARCGRRLRRVRFKADFVDEEASCGLVCDGLPFRQFWQQHCSPLQLLTNLHLADTDCAVIMQSGAMLACNVFEQGGTAHRPRCLL